MTEKTGLWYRCRDFVTEQSAGEWSDKVIADDTDAMMKFVLAEIELAKQAKTEAV
jgi:hypothetical protein